MVEPYQEFTTRPYYAKLLQSYEGEIPEDLCSDLHINRGTIGKLYSFEDNEFHLTSICPPYDHAATLHDQKVVVLKDDPYLTVRYKCSKSHAHCQTRYRLKMQIHLTSHGGGSLADFEHLFAIGCQDNGTPEVGIGTFWGDAKFYDQVQGAEIFWSSSEWRFCAPNNPIKRPPCQ